MGHQELMFGSEDQLRQTAVPVLKRDLTDNDAQIVEEFSYSGGRTDLVFSYVSDAYRSRRVEELGVGIPIEDKEKLKVFLHLHKKDKPVLKENFLRKSGWNSENVSEELDWLVNHNFVTENGDKIRTKPYLRRHITTSIAIELKLEKWKRALQQALKSRAYSEYQYVVIDAGNIERATRELELFEKHEIGLISISSAGELEIFYDPERQTPYSELNVWKLNETTLLPSST